MFKWPMTLSGGGGRGRPVLTTRLTDAVCASVTKKYCAEKGLGQAIPQRFLSPNPFMDMEPAALHSNARILHVRLTSLHVSAEEVVVLIAFILGLAGCVLFMLMDLRMHPKCKFFVEFCLGLGFAVIGRIPYLMMKIQRSTEVLCPAVCLPDVFIPAPALPM